MPLAHAGRSRQPHVRRDRRLRRLAAGATDNYSSSATCGFRRSSHNSRGIRPAVIVGSTSQTVVPASFATGRYRTSLTGYIPNGCRCRLSGLKRQDDLQSIPDKAESAIRTSRSVAAESCFSQAHNGRWTCGGPGPIAIVLSWLGRGAATTASAATVVRLSQPARGIGIGFQTTESWGGVQRRSRQFAIRGDCESECSSCATP